MTDGVQTDSTTAARQGGPLAAEPVLEESAFFHTGAAGAVTRALAAVCFAAAAALVAVAASLTPDPRGHGTHEQLSLAPCGFRFATGYPCPTCGMTTSFAEMAHFRFVAAFVHQPLGAAAFVALLAAAGGWLYTAATGRRWPPSIGLFLRSPRFLYGMLAAGLGSWGYLIFMAYLDNQAVAP